jgi:hypothetical protein
MISREGLVAEYLFDGNADDTSGGGFHGLVNGAMPVPDRFGTPNSAYMFDGKDDYIIVSPPPKLTNVALTVSVWARCAAPKQRWWHDCIICQDNGDDDDRSRRIFQLSMLQDRIVWHRMVEAPDPFTIDPVTPGVWYHCAVVFGDGLHKLYVNGALNNSVRHKLAVHADEPLYIGRKGTDEKFFYFDGVIDDIRIYNRALTGEEIQSLL